MKYLVILLLLICGSTAHAGFLEDLFKKLGQPTQPAKASYWQTAEALCRSNIPMISSKKLRLLPLWIKAAFSGDSLNLI